MSSIQSLILAVVRGELEIAELARLGVVMRISDERATIEEPLGISSVVPSMADIATGLLVHWARSTTLREWTRVVLGANFIDLVELEHDPAGERLLQALWSGIDGNLSEDEVSLAQLLAEGSRRGEK